MKSVLLAHSASEAVLNATGWRPDVDVLDHPSRGVDQAPVGVHLQHQALKHRDADLIMGEIETIEQVYIWSKRVKA